MKFGMIPPSQWTEKHKARAKESFRRDGLVKCEEKLWRAIVAKKGSASKDDCDVIIALLREVIEELR